MLSAALLLLSNSLFLSLRLTGESGSFPRRCRRRRSGRVWSGWA